MEMASKQLQLYCWNDQYVPTEIYSSCTCKKPQLVFFKEKVFVTAVILLCKAPMNPFSSFITSLITYS